MDSQTSASLSLITVTLNKQSADDLEVQQALDLALDILKTGDFNAQWDIAKLLPKFGDRAIPALLSMLQEEEDDDLLWFVARVLGQFDHPMAIAALTNLLQTSDNPEVLGMAATTLASFGEAAIAPLTELLQSDSSRLIAVQALAQIPNPAIADVLLDVVHDAVPAVRAAAIEAVGRLGDRRSLDIVMAALQDKSAEVRRAAVLSLGTRADWHTEQPLAALLKPMVWDLNVEVGRQAIIALGRIGTAEATAALFEVLQSAYAPLPLQLEAIRALSWNSSIETLTYLQQGLTSSSELADDRQRCEEIIMSLGRVTSSELKPQATQILLDTLQSNYSAVQDPRSKQAIALSLGHLGQLSAMDALIQLLADSDTGVRLHAIAALKQLDAQHAYQQLEALSQQSLKPPLKEGIAIALQEWHL